MGTGLWIRFCVGLERVYPSRRCDEDMHSRALLQPQAVVPTAPAWPIRRTVQHGPGVKLVKSGVR